MTHHVDVSNLAAGMNDSVIQLELGLLAPCCLGRFPNFGLIIRLDALKECFESRFSTLRVKTQHAVAFLGPIPDLTGGGGPCPTARMAEPLRFRQVCLALLQFLLCSLALITIRIRSIPFHDFSLLVSERHGAAQAPPICAGRRSRSDLTFIRF